MLLLLIILAAAGTVVWLRYEFERVKNDGTAGQWDHIAVTRINDNLPAILPCKEQYLEKKAWFGALHVHTSASYDATAFGGTTSVDDAYRFAQGTPLHLSLREDPPDYEPPVITISAPLDFMAVTDHAEALGENRLCYSDDNPGYSTLVCRLFRGDLRLPVKDTLQPMVRLVTHAIFGQDRSARVCGKDGSRCRQRAEQVWRENQRATEAWQDRSAGCRFTTLHGYEYTLAEESSNLHRNVLFKSAVVPQMALSAKDAPEPELLWQWLTTTCIDGNPQCDALAIPHNSNWSSGRMWFPLSNQPRPENKQKQLAALRKKVEPLAEILQVKGDSECRNGIASVFGAADEFCDFEKLRPPLEDISDCGEEIGSGGMLLKGCASRYSYVRYALTAGLAEWQKLGENPFEMGIVAATDTHNGMASAGLEKNHPGSHGTDRNIQHRLLGKVDVPGDIAQGSPVRYNPGGVAGVYAHENSRQALFEAMRARETFGTSGPRIAPRFFAGWNISANLCQSPDYPADAYEQGVPMGSILLPAKQSIKSPYFVASAVMDGRDGGNLLQRIQIIKGWIDSEGRTQQAVYDIAGDSNGSAAVDPQTCAVSGTGFEQLCTTWQDPEFDPAQSAVYYARVLENPSCRWSHYTCLELAEEKRPDSCRDPQLPWQIQERAWTSPIWYYPDNKNLGNPQLNYITIGQ